MRRRRVSALDIHSVKRQHSQTPQSLKEEQNAFDVSKRLACRAAGGRNGIHAGPAHRCAASRGRPAPASLGALTFGPNGVLFAADTQAATVYALELGDQATGGKSGAADVAAIDQKIASVLGTAADAVSVKDLVDPSGHPQRVSCR